MERADERPSGGAPGSAASSDVPGEAGNPRRLLRQLLVTLLLTGVSLVLVVRWTGLLPQELLGKLRPGWLAVAALALVFSWVVRSLRVWLLVRTLDEAPPFLALLTDFVSSLFVSGVTPTASGGFPFFVYALGRRGVGWGTALAANVFDTVINVLTVAFLGVLAWILLLSYAAGRTGGVLLVGVAVWVVLGMAISIVSLLAPRPLAGWLYRVALRLRREGRRPRLTRLVHASAGLAALHTRAVRKLRRRGRAPLVYNFLLNLVYWVAFLSVSPLILAALGLVVKDGPGAPLWLDAIFAHLTYHLAQNAIPTPGAAGGAEVGIAYLFKPYLAADRLGGFVLLWRLLTYYFQLAVGGLFLPRTLRQMIRGRA
ncbi:lysylphosphatidylglycerol synthase transmembrane domain-containing protein [Limnochorda pilosa]|uniref:Phosphatidylglycerol lysyltransferase n=1 Tax=Limnochorda pilosa TaxID=1555112 RepID=A0A0K2SGG9_LIMPI|nr:flippase-like domain-containing protein [Limnochorda pilosa]BAS25944.1 hypothetical protein LIP_0087 [Limnochorda pilosa]